MDIEQIKKFFIKNRVLVVVLLLVFGWSYWFQFRPASIRANCVRRAESNAIRQYVFRLKEELLGTCSNEDLEDCPSIFDECNINYCLENQEEFNRKKTMGYFSKSDYKTYYDRCLNELGLRK